MPRIPRTEQTVGVSAAQQPFSTGDGYAAPGKALSEVGKQMQSLALHLEKQDEEMSAFEGQTAYQDWRNKEHQRRLQADTNLSGDGRGHVEREDQATEQSFNDVRQRFADRPRVARRLEQQFGNDRNSWGTRSFTAQQGRIGPFYTEQAGNHFTNSIQPNLFARDPETGVPFETRLDSVRRGAAMVDQWLDGAVGLPAAAREKIRGELTERLYEQWRQNAGPEAAVEREEVIRQLQQRRAGVTSLDALEQPADMTLDAERPPAERRPRRGDPRPAGDLEVLPVPGGATPRGARPRTGAVEGIVIHHTAGTTLDSAISQNRLAGTGYNYYVDQEGKVYRFASDEQRMVHIRNPGDQHRARGEWDNLNLDNTISVSAVAPSDEAVTPAQRQAIERLVGQLARQHGVEGRNIVGHGDIQGGPGGNREASEGTGTARAFREGRIPLDGSAPVRLAQAGGTMTDAGGAPPPVTTEQRVWERIVGSAVELENFSRQERRRLEVDERIQETADRREAANEGRQMLENLQLRRLRDSETPGISSAPSAERPELTQEWLDANRDRLTETAFNRLLTGLNGTGRARWSDPSVQANLYAMSRDINSPPQVVADLALDAYTSHVLTRRDYDLVLGNVRSRRGGPQVQVPSGVSDSYRELNRAIGIPRRGAAAEERQLYSNALSELNQYVTDQMQSGSLDFKGLGDKVKELSGRFRQGSINDRVRQLAAEPRSRFLNAPADRATLDDVTGAMTAASQHAHMLAATMMASPGVSGPLAPELAELAREAHHLRRLHETLADKYRFENNGKDPPPPKPTTPAAPGASAEPTAPGPSSPGDANARALEQRNMGEPLPPQAPPAYPRRRTRNIKRDPETGDIIGVEEVED